MTFNHREDGSVAMVFGLSVFIFIGALALAIDFARAVSTRTSLAALADSAALAGAVYLRSSNSAALSQAYNAFDAGKARNAATVTRTMKLGPDGRSVIAEASATVDTYFGGVIGMRRLTVSVKSEALSRIGYLDVQLLLDVSGSMDLAATPDEMTRLKSLTKPYIDAWAALPANANNGGAAAYAAENGCAFACHIREGWEPNGGTAFDFARSNNVLLRWDVVTQGATSMAEALLNGAAANANGPVIQVGGYAFGDALQPIFGLTTSPSNISFQLGASSIRQYNTRLNDALGQMKDVIGVAGDGTTQQSARKVLVLATDGVDGGRGGSHQPLDPTQCDLIKSQGVIIAVLNVKYVKDTASNFFNGAVGPFYDQIEPQLQQCATSPDLYIAASDPAGIRAAFAAMADRVVNLSPRLSN